MESKRLSLNLQKSSIIVFGDSKLVERIKEEVRKKPLMLSGKKMEEVKTIKYLGDRISNSLQESIHQTVMKRIGLAKQAVYEIRAIIEDRRAHCIGGINLAFEIFNVSVLTMIFYNSETWDFIPKKTYKVLDDLFLHFF